MNNELNFPPNFEGLVLGCIDADFASKYSLESSRRDLHNALLSTVLESNPTFAPFPKLNFFFKGRFCRAGDSRAGLAGDLELHSVLREQRDDGVLLEHVEDLVFV